MHFFASDTLDFVFKMLCKGAPFKELFRDLIWATFRYRHSNFQTKGSFANSGYFSSLFDAYFVLASMLILYELKS